MSQAELSAPVDPQVPASGGKRWLPATGALLAGALVGVMVVAPRLGGAADAGAESDSHAPADDGHGGKAGPVASVTLENVIVNPAGSAGSRYVIASVEFVFDSPDVAARMQANESAIRDAVGTVLERASIDELTRPGGRDLVRRQLDSLATVHAGVGPSAVHLPQFLIQ